MKVLIVGLNHRIQLSAIEMQNVDLRQAAIERQQKERFNHRLRELAEQNGIEFIGEEMDAATLIPEVDNDRRSVYDFLAGKGLNPVAPSTPIEVIGHQVAEMCGIAYAEVDLCRAEREKRGIPRDYTDEGKYPPDKVAEWHRVREQCMFERTMASAGEARSVLVICGYDHMRCLAELFRIAGCTVELVDLRKEPWYIDNWNA